MKHLLTGLCCLISGLSYGAHFPPHTYYNVCFTPGQNCTRMITAQIGRAKHTIYMQGYSFTSYQIAHALVKAYQHGVKVYVILDQSNFDQKHFSQAKLLIKNHIPVWNDNTLRIAHNKVMIFDKHTIETGSFNFTYGAQHHNAENALVIDDKILANQYLNNWFKRKAVSTRIN